MSDELTDTGETVSAKRYYTTSAGVKLEVKAVSLLLIAKIEQAAAKEAEIKFPGAPPTYTVTDGGGGVTLEPHDDATATEPEDKAALATYRAALKQRRDFAGDRVMRFLFSRGVIFDYPANDDWVEEQTSYGIDVPTNPRERRTHYIETEIIQSREDIEGLSSAIMSASGVDMEAVKAARDSFRSDLRPVAGSGETDTTGQPGGAIPTAETGPEVVDEPTVYGAEDSEILSPYAVAMG